MEMENRSEKSRTARLSRTGLSVKQAVRVGGDASYNGEIGGFFCINYVENNPFVFESGKKLNGLDRFRSVNDRKW